MATTPIRFGITGVSGFSERHLDWVERAGAAGGPAQLAAVALIVENEATAATAERLRGRGVTVVLSYDELLGLHDQVDIITLPVGIHLHEPLAAKALRAHHSVYLEKPAAGTAAGIGSLAAAQRASSGRLLLGFQTMYQPAMWELKQRLLSGLVGTIRKVVITLPWSRQQSYFTRNRWAGKIRFADTLIYDSPMNNAGGHFLNSALFLAGPRLHDAAVPLSVEAELYRANQIESADNCFVRFQAGSGIEILYLASVSCREQRDATIDIIGDTGRVIVTDRPERALAPWTEIDASGDVREVGANLPRPEIFNCVAQAVADSSYDRVSTLKTASLTTVANEIAFAAAPIADLPKGSIKEIPTDAGPLSHLDDIDAILQQLRHQAALPHETGHYPWSVQPGTLPEKKTRDLLAQTGIDFC